MVQVFNLVSNEGQRWGEDNLRRALMAALLLKILKEAGYFPAEATSFEVAFVGSLLLRNLQVRPVHSLKEAKLILMQM